MIIRPVEERDIESLLDIYNHEVKNGVATFDLNPKTIEEWTQWYYEHHEGNHIAIVCEVDGNAVGYASLSGYRTKEAYKSTVELSVYVSDKYRKMGIATRLMTDILDIARSDDSIHSVISVITSSNEVSKKLHERFGFTYSGTLHQVAYKMGGFRDIDNYELIV